MNLRPYQLEAIEKARQAVRTGARRLLLVAPTGSGKTVVGAALASNHVERGGRVVWLAHRTELITHAAASIERCGLRVGVVAASSSRAPDPAAPVQVCSPATLLARDHRPPATLVVADEAHHFAAETFADLLNSYRGALAIGLTATPERGDGLGLGDAFERMILVARPRELVEAGHLVPCEVIAPSRQLRPGEIAARPVEAYLRHAKGRPALVFSPTVKAAEEHAAEFVSAGIEARVVEGRTNPREREEYLAEFGMGRLPVLCNVAVLTEGTDLPIASCAILARGCGTPGLFLQIAGRILRPAPGKTDSLLIDLRGVTHQHGHPADDRQYALRGRGIRRDTDYGADETSYCRVCGGIVEPGAGCEECGIGPAQARPLRVTNDPLVKYAAMRAEGPEKRIERFARWMLTARQKGYKPKAPHGKFRAVYGVWPSRDIETAAEAIVKARGAAA